MKKEPFDKGTLYELQAEINMNHGKGNQVVTRHLRNSAALIKLFGAHLTPREADLLSQEGHSSEGKQSNQSSQRER